MGGEAGVPTDGSLAHQLPKTNIGEEAADASGVRGNVGRTITDGVEIPPTGRGETKGAGEVLQEGVKLPHDNRRTCLLYTPPTPRD